MDCVPPLLIMDRKTAMSRPLILFSHDEDVLFEDTETEQVIFRETQSEHDILKTEHKNIPVLS